jgi:hypothetical protein
MTALLAVRLELVLLLLLLHRPDGDAKAAEPAAE